MSRFVQALRALSPTSTTSRRWSLVLYDQLSDQIGPLSQQPPEQSGIVLIESAAKARRRPYHRQKLALILSNQRHFALEQARRGVAVRYIVAEETYAEALAPIIAELGPLPVMRPAEREARAELSGLIASGGLREVPHGGWLTSTDDLYQSTGEAPPWRMDRFYRHIRKRTGVLMDAQGKPVGGKYSFDHDNRKPWRGDPPAPEPPSFSTDDPIKVEVAALVAARFSAHPGAVRLASLPATQADAAALWAWAKASCLPHFGPYEDALSERSRGLFHTRISPVLNLHRLLPSQVVAEAAALDIPLNSREGFIRQVLGWREFVRHVHEATDGFRDIPDAAPVPAAASPGDGGWGRQAGSAWPEAGGDGGACPTHLGGDLPVPAAWWGAPSGMRCLDQVVAGVWEEGWSHHIPRLMVLSNIAMLLGVSPRALADWFWCAYTDAYDWVVEPNVLGMGTFAAGPVMTTKPYAAGGAYINRMSDFCRGCAFNPRRDCPVTSLYWTFLERNAAVLEDIFRMKPLLRNLSRRSPEQRARDAAVTASVQEALLAGRRVPGSGSE